ncbi:MAG: glycosyltransferase [Actinomycetota bacterium]
MEKATLEVCTRLKASGAEVKILTARPNARTGCSGVGGVAVHTVRAVDLTRWIGAQVCVAPGAYGAALELAEDFSPHVLYANGLYFQTTLAAARCSRRCGIPLVTTVQVGSLEHLPRLTRWLTGIYGNAAGRWILHSSDRIIAVAPAVAAHAVKLGADNGKVRVVPNGVDLQRFTPSTGGLNPHAPPVILFVGRLIANKGPAVLVDALGELNDREMDFRAVFLGDGPQLAGLRRQVEGLGLGRRVSFEGSVSDVSGWLRRAQVMVRPSFTEGLPLAILEAMACGVPVVASNIAGNRDLVVDGQTGLLFSPGDHRALADKLVQVMEGETAAALSAAGRRVSRSYSWESVASAVSDVLSEVALKPV